jgi:hypothetical protein
MRLEVWDERNGDEYTRGLLDGVRRFAYTSSQAWAEPGVHYVGTTGKTLREAEDEILHERDYQRADV